MDRAVYITSIIGMVRGVYTISITSMVIVVNLGNLIFMNGGAYLARIKGMGTGRFIVSCMGMDCVSPVL
jgi:hypothetical protein